MIIAIILLSAAVLVLLALYFAKCRKIDKMTLELHNIPKGDSNGLLHTIGSDSDIRRLTAEINALLRELRQTEIRYRRKSHDLEQMMTNISHDLRTPLTSALGYVGMLQNPDLPEAERRRELATIEKRLQRLEELIDAFFEFSGVISGEKMPDTVPLNLVGVLEESIGHYFDEFSNRNREIRFVCGEAKLTVTSNRNMLLRVFDNLIGNACRHGQGDLQITVTAADKISVCFENPLSDPNLEIDRVFDEFYTTDISRTKGHTGLGLAIAKQFTELLGGEIRASYGNGLFAVTVDVGVTKSCFSMQA